MLGFRVQESIDSFTQDRRELGMRLVEFFVEAFISSSQPNVAQIREALADVDLHDLEMP
jgi:hypothetical protein